MANAAQYLITQAVNGAEITLSGAYLSFSIGAVLGGLAGPVATPSGAGMYTPFPREFLRESEKALFRQQNAIAANAANVGGVTLIRSTGTSIISNALPSDGSSPFISGNTVNPGRLGGLTRFDILDIYFQSSKQSTEDLGIVMVYPNGRQVYQGPLTPRN